LGHLKTGCYAEESLSRFFALDSGVLTRYPSSMGKSRQAPCLKTINGRATRQRAKWPCANDTGVYEGGEISDVLHPMIAKLCTMPSTKPRRGD